MVKNLFFLIVCLLFLETARAQTATSVYYLLNSGKVVSVKDSADLVLLIFPPDTGVDKKLFIVKEYYKTGKLRLIGNSITQGLNIKFQGTQISYFPSGSKMRIKNYEAGELVGDMIEYYPNGKFYNSKTYVADKKIIYNEYRDSTGKVLAENGTGSWVDFSIYSFKSHAEGPVLNGYKEGEWHTIIEGKVQRVITYKKGEMTSSALFDTGQIFTSVDTPPGFAGGPEAFGRFLGKTIHYPADAKESNIQGRVVVTFVVERDGALSDLRILRSLGGGCDEESIRVLKLSPPWIPGTSGGKPVRVQYSVPIAYTLSE